MDRILNDQLIELVFNTIGTHEQLADFFGLPVSAVRATKSGKPPARYNRKITSRYIDKRTPEEKAEGLRLQRLRRLGQDVKHKPAFPRVLNLQEAKAEMIEHMKAGHYVNQHPVKEFIFKPRSWQDR